MISCKLIWKIKGERTLFVRFQNEDRFCPLPRPWHMFQSNAAGVIFTPLWSNIEKTSSNPGVFKWFIVSRCASCLALISGHVAFAFSKFFFFLLLSIIVPCSPHSRPTENFCSSFTSSIGVAAPKISLCALASQPRKPSSCRISPVWRLTVEFGVLIGSPYHDRLTISPVGFEWNLDSHEISS